MSQKLYRLFFTLLPKFRVEPERKGRCLGELVRRNVSKNFPQGGNTALTDIKRWEANYAALEALVNNIEQKSFARTHISTSTGVTVEMATSVITEFNKNVLNTPNLGEEVAPELKVGRETKVAAK